MRNLMTNEDWLGHLPNVVRVFETLPVLEVERSNIEHVARQLLEESSPARLDIVLAPERLSKDELRNLIQHCDEILPLLDRMGESGHDMCTFMVFAGVTGRRPPYWPGTDQQWSDFLDSTPQLLASELRALRQVASSFPWPARANRPSAQLEWDVTFAALDAFKKLTGQEPDKATQKLIEFVQSMFGAVGITIRAKVASKQSPSAKSMTKRVLKRWRELQGPQPEEPDPYADN